PDPPPVTTFAVSGRVVDNDAGGPLAAARVELTRADAAPLAAQTDAEGRYLIDNLPAGSYALRASADGFASSTVPIELAEDTVVDLALTREDEPPDPAAPPDDERWTISGSVCGAGSGTALARARVEVVKGPAGTIGRSASTAPDGAFALSDLAPGMLEVRGSADGHLPKSVAVTLQADASIDIALDAAPPPGPEVSGVVADVLTDRALANVVVRIEGGGEATSDAAGAFTLNGVAGRSFQEILFTSPDAVDRRTYLRTSGPAELVTMMPRSIDLHAFDEMLRAHGGLL